MKDFLNDYRVFPRLILLFLMYTLIEFHNWFTDGGVIKVTDLQEFTLIGYSTVLAAYIGAFKFYLETGKNNE